MGKWLKEEQQQEQQTNCTATFILAVKKAIDSNLLLREGQTTPSISNSYLKYETWIGKIRKIRFRFALSPKQAIWAILTMRSSPNLY